MAKELIALLLGYFRATLPFGSLTALSYIILQVRE